MPPVTPSRMRRPSNGLTMVPLLAAAPGHDVVLDRLFARELLERLRGQLLLVNLRAHARKLVENARVLRRDEHAEVLVGRVLRDLDRGENLHLISLALSVQLQFQPLDDRAHIAFDVLQPFPAQPLRIDDARHAGRCAILIIIHDYVLISLHRLQLHECAQQPALERVPRFRSASAQPVQQDLTRRRKHVHQHRLRKRAPELHCALDVDVHDDVVTQLEDTFDLGAKRAVQIPVHLSTLGELAALLPREKLAGGEKIIVLPFFLVVARWSRGARHRVPDILPYLEQSLCNRRLATSGRRREDDREHLHSTFSTCSAIRSSSSFTATTSCSSAASFDLLPVVFASRNIPCNRNPSRFPTASCLPLASVSRNAETCERKRSTSSLTSSRSASSAISCASRC